MEKRKSKGWEREREEDQVLASTICRREATHRRERKVQYTPVLTKTLRRVYALCARRQTKTIFKLFPSGVRHFLANSDGFHLNATTLSCAFQSRWTHIVVEVAVTIRVIQPKHDWKETKRTIKTLESRLKACSHQFTLNTNGHSYIPRQRIIMNGLWGKIGLKKFRDRYISGESYTQTWNEWIELENAVIQTGARLSSSVKPLDVHWFCPVRQSSYTLRKKGGLGPLGL